MRIIEPSELIINPNGSIFHLHLRPQDIADTILL
ncbi:MAG: phosphorylase, partial [Bacteroidales bacterium]|nr:phosphorylase [Bacteroidales bacterium]